MRSVKIFWGASICTLLAACASHTWVPGPQVAISDFDQQKAQCSMMARHGGTGFFAAGNPNFVAGAALGHGIGNAVRGQQDFNDCMLMSGWKIADK